MDVTSGLYINHSDLIEYNFQINIKSKNLYRLIGLSNVNIDNVSIGQLNNTVRTQTELDNLFTIYSELGILNKSNELDKNYIMLAKLLHETFDIDDKNGNIIKELKNILEEFKTNFINVIKGEFKNIMTSLNTIHFSYELSGKNIELIITFETMKKFLFSKGTERLEYFDYSKRNLLAQEENFKRKTDVHIYISAILVTLQVFGDGNHRTAYQYLKNQIYITKNEYMKLIVNFRKKFNDHDYSRFDNKRAEYFVNDVVKQFGPYIEKSLLKGGSKKKKYKKTRKYKKNTEKNKKMLSKKK